MTGNLAVLFGGMTCTYPYTYPSGLTAANVIFQGRTIEVLTDLIQLWDIQEKVNSVMAAAESQAVHAWQANRGLGTYGQYARITACRPKNSMLGWHDSASDPGKTTVLRQDR